MSDEDACMTTVTVDRRMVNEYDNGDDGEGVAVGMFRYRRFIIDRIKQDSSKMCCGRCHNRQYLK